jgi:hypothetical protein
MGLKGYRLWTMGQMNSTCRAQPMLAFLHRRGSQRARAADADDVAVRACARVVPPG